MPIFWPFAFLLIALLLAGDDSPAPADVFNSGEKSQLVKANNNVERRIKVYDTASRRIQKDLGTAAAKEDFETVPDNLKLWTSLLSKSLEDIQGNLKTKKKSRALINYEIQLRKSITNLQSFKIRAPVEQQDLFDSSIAQTETVRKKLVEILFHR
jgi:hypothetical protein